MKEYPIIDQVIAAINQAGYIKAMYSTPSRYFAALNEEGVALPKRDGTDLLPLSGSVVALVMLTGRNRFPLVDRIFHFAPRQQVALSERVSLPSRSATAPFSTSGDDMG